jgi:hypothetical protein
LESVSLTPPFRVGGPQVDRGDRSIAVPAAGRRSGLADVPGGDAVNGIGIVRDLDAPIDEILAKS